MIPIHTTHFSMPQKNLLYTAINRAKRLLVIVETKKAVEISDTSKTAKIYSSLRQYLLL
jgi:ATP-dependent exoDNAse (exonuclease V) alpha subunit